MYSRATGSSPSFDSLICFPACPLLEDLDLTPPAPPPPCLGYLLLGACPLQDCFSSYIGAVAFGF